MPEPILVRETRELDGYLDLEEFNPEVIKDALRIIFENQKNLVSRVAELEDRVTSLENK